MTDYIKASLIFMDFTLNIEILFYDSFRFHIEI
jgi:hypothetical protein